MYIEEGVNMKVTDALKGIMKLKGITQKHMAKLVGKEDKGASYVSAKLCTDNWTVDSVIEFLEQMDYELVIKPKSRGKRSESEIVLEHSKKGDE